MASFTDLRRRGLRLLRCLTDRPRSAAEAAAVRADDELIERLRAGGSPPADDPLAALLAAWLADADRPPADRQ